MIMIDFVDEGPTADTPWLQERALGRTYRLHHRRGMTHYYRVDLFNRNTRVKSYEEDFETEELAISWARTKFIQYLIDERLLPVGGVILE